MMRPTEFFLGKIDPRFGEVIDLIKDVYILDPSRNEVVVGTAYEYADDNRYFFIYGNEGVFVQNIYTKEELLNKLNKQLNTAQKKVNKIKSEIDKLNLVKKEKFLLEASLSKDAFFSLVKKRDEEGYDLVCFSEITSAISIYRALFKLRDD
jgi:predicted ABC-type ATPase